MDRIGLAPIFPFYSLRASTRLKILPINLCTYIVLQIKQSHSVFSLQLLQFLSYLQQFYFAVKDKIAH